jgi:hypothetical protein
MPSEIIIALAFPLAVFNQLCHAIHWHLPDKDVTLPESIASAILLEGWIAILMHGVGCLGMQNWSEGLKRGCHRYQSLLGKVLGQREKLWVLWERGGQRNWIWGFRIESELQIIEGECVEKFFLWCERVLFQEFLLKNFKPFYVSDHVGDNCLVRDCGAIQIEFLASLLKKVLKFLLDQFVILFGHDYQDTALSKKSKMSSEWFEASPLAEILHWDDLSPS